LCVTNIREKKLNLVIPLDIVTRDGDITLEVHFDAVRGSRCFAVHALLGTVTVYVHACTYNYTGIYTIPFSLKIKV